MYQTKHDNCRKESFQTKVNLFLFRRCVDCRGVIQFENNDFNKYQITDEDIVEYAGVYWQQKVNFKIKEITIDTIYAAIKAWKDNHYPRLQELEMAYKNNFSKLLLCNDIEELFKSTNCFYCGITIENINNLIDNKKIFKKHDLRGFTMEIDRKEPNKEYTKDNIVLCCYWCNNAKTDEFNADEFKPIGEAIGKVWKKRLVIEIP